MASWNRVAAFWLYCYLNNKALNPKEESQHVLWDDKQSSAGKNFVHEKEKTPMQRTKYT